MLMKKQKLGSNYNKNAPITSNITIDGARALFPDATATLYNDHYTSGDKLITKLLYYIF